MAYGPEETNKIPTIEYVLDRETIGYVAVDSRECLSQRHVLTKIFARCVTKLSKQDMLDKCDRLDNINALAGNLRKLFHGRKSRFVILLDNVDHSRGASSTLLPSLARLGDLVCDAL